jgi:LysM repeat protein
VQSVVHYAKWAAALVALAVLIPFQLVAPRTAAHAATTTPKVPSRAAVKPRVVSFIRRAFIPRTYTVKAGDCLYFIAKRFGWTWQEVWYANRHVIKNPNLIYPGQTLDITGPQPVVPASFDAYQVTDPKPVADVSHTSAAPRQAPVTSAPAVGGNFAQWWAEAEKILIDSGTPAGDLSMGDELVIATCESALGTNVWGDGSYGINQTNPDTFAAYALPGMGFGDASLSPGAPIWNEVYNMVAAIRYAVARYGNMANVPGVVSTGGNANDCAAYVGY